MTLPAKSAVPLIDGTVPSAPVIDQGSATPANPPQLKTHCQSCSVRERCLPFSLDAEDIRQIDALISNRVKLKRDEALYCAGDTFQSLYAVRLGSLKTTVLAEDGREQVSGYHMPGDIIGLDGIGAGRHGSQAVALEHSEICVLPFARLEELARAVPQFQHNLHRFLSREIARDQNLMLLLGSMRAEERLAVFLLSLADRYRRRGYSSTEFVLRMSRGDIGSYLGMKLETVSRLFSQFRAKGLIQVQGRAVKLLNPTALRELGGQHD